jgi:phage FluMu protein Com
MMITLRCAQCRRFYGEAHGEASVYCRECKVHTYYDDDGRVVDVLDRVAARR